MNKKRMSPKAGCPEEAFGWIAGGVMAVKASVPQVRNAVGAVTLFKVHPEVQAIFKLLEQVDSGPWTLALCGHFYDSAVELSSILKTRAVFLGYDDCTGLICYEIFDRGNSVERFKSSDDPSSKAKSESKLLCKMSVNTDGWNVTFESRLKTATKAALADDRRFIDQRFKELGICLPAKSVC